MYSDIASLYLNFFVVFLNIFFCVIVNVMYVNSVFVFSVVSSVFLFRCNLCFYIRVGVVSFARFVASGEIDVLFCF